MKLFTYSPGGIYPDEEKLTREKAFERLRSPSVVVIPLSQHTGAPNTPLVKVGDHVLVGTLIGSSSQFVSAPVHSSVSGDVIAIEERIVPSGNKVQSVVIKNDFKDEWVELKAVGNLDSVSKEELIKVIRDSGIVGLGGAAFPTAVKLSPPMGKVINTVIANGAECELYLTTDHRVMLEFTDDVINGLLIEMKATGAKEGIIAVENNKIDAANALEQRVKDRNITNVEVVLVKTKYPQGGEKQLVKAILGKEIPSGGLPLDVGVVVQNVGTLKAVADAVLSGRPLIERGITVSGTAVQKPGNYIVRIGTQVKDIIDELGLNRKLRKLIFGGPMTGVAQSTVDAPVVKGTSGILMFGEEAFDMSPDEESPCIRCASCVDNCPMGLLPTLIDYASRRQDLKLAEELHALDCIECGVCSYVCPANRHLTENIKKAKQGIIKQKKIEAAKQAAFEKLKALKEKERLEKQAREEVQK
ncbi:MAG: electron transport complex subunit RsxC [Caldisericaceae bacterium]